MNLELNELAANRSFIFLWCGSSDGLDKGRDCLRRWGFRRCEDICWVQTNIKNPKHSINLESHSLFRHTKVSNYFTIFEWCIQFYPTLGTLFDGYQRNNTSIQRQRFYSHQYWYRFNHQWRKWIRFYGKTVWNI